MYKINMQKLNTVIKCIIPLSLAFAILLFTYLVVLITNVTNVRVSGAELIELSNNVLHDNDKLIKLMRLYTTTLDGTVLREYESTLNTLDDSFARLTESDNLIENEKVQLSTIGGLLDRLANIEDRAFGAIEVGDYELARSLVYGQEYINLDNEFSRQITSFINNKKIRINEASDQSTSQGTVGLLSLALCILFTLLGAVLTLNMFAKKLFWYESIIDNIPFVVSAIDNDMKFTFVNKLGLKALGKELKDTVGLPCNTWSDICSVCNTPDCGVECFKRGETQTSYTSGDKHYQVDIAELKDKKGRQIGYLEFDQDVTTLVSAQKAADELVEGIRQSIYSFSSVSNQISDTASRVAQETSEESDIINGIANMTTKKGKEQMDDMLKIMGEISDANKNIIQITKLIDDVARQINILALNASVEAVRAGEHGKSFAIVAQEVRNLAIKSAEAVVNSENYISISTEKVEAGSQVTEKMSDNMKDIVDSFNQTSGIVSDIAMTNEKQAASIQEINSNIKTLESLIEQFSSGVSNA